MIPCTMRQLEIFVAAAEDCHFVRTANRLGISQPAVSKHIAQLETQLGTTLFTRHSGGKPSLSSDGVALLGEARAFLNEGAKLRKFRRRENPARRSVVRLCAGAHLLEDCIKPRLIEFHEEHPELMLECQAQSSPTRGAPLVRSGRVDLMLFTVRNPDHVPLHAEVLRPVRFGLYGGRSFERYKRASAAELMPLPFILPLEGSAPDKMVQAALLEANLLVTNVVARAQYSEVILDMARRGHGIAALFETMLPADGTKDLIKLDVELPTRYRTLFRLSTPATAPVQTVIDFLRRELR